jgi:hypothetical protein
LRGVVVVVVVVVGGDDVAECWRQVTWPTATAGFVLRDYCAQVMYDHLV